MKYLGILLLVIGLSGCMATVNAEEELTVNDIIELCQKQGYFTYNGLTFSCKQLFVVE